MAQIAAEVRRSWVSKKDSVSYKDFLPKYGKTSRTEDPDLPTDNDTPEELEAKKKRIAQRSQMAWGAVVGVPKPK